MCLTGVDYFSTLAYQPSIAFLAAGTLAPMATLVLVMLTLFGALPMYHRVADMSPYGQGSILILEKLFPKWKGKALVLSLLGFAATSFIITITLSAADAAAHLVENPLTPFWLRDQWLVTIVLLLLLGAIFLRGFKEAIGLAVVIVIAYLALNTVVLIVGAREIWRHPEVLTQWRASLFVQHGNPAMMAAMAVILFPKLALGLSGFETGVAVMPLVRGDPTDTEEQPRGTNPEHQETAVGGGADHERLSDGQQRRVGAVDSRRSLSARRRRRRPGARLSRPPIPGPRLRHGIRPGDRRHSLVRRGVRAGRPPEPGAALSAALRHGAGVGARDTAAGRRSSPASASSSRSCSAPTSMRRRARMRPASSS